MNLETIGIVLAVGGSLTSIIGTLYNNLKLEHTVAMLVWSISNPILLIWSVGYSFGYWNGGLSGWALIAMYGTYAVTNFYGLYKVCK